MIKLSSFTSCDRWVAIFIVWLHLAVIVEPVSAQQDAELTSSETGASLLGQIEQLEERLQKAELSEEQTAALTESLSGARQQVSDAQKKNQQAHQFAQSLQNVVQSADSKRAELENLATVAPDPAPDTSLTELEGQLTRQSANVAKAEAELQAADRELAEATQRRTQIETDTPRLEKQISDLKSQVGIAADNPDPTLTDQITDVTAKTSRLFFQETLAANQAEAALIEASTSAGLYQVQRDLKARKLEIAQAQLAVFQAAVTQLRTDDANTRMKAAADDLEESEPLFRPVAERNQQLAALNKQLTLDIETVTSELEAQRQKLKQIRQDLQSAQDRVELVSLTDAVGSQLRTMKQSLPDAATFRVSWTKRQTLINDQQFKLMELIDQRNADQNLAVARLLRRQNIPAAERGRLKLLGEEKLQAQRTEYLDPAINNQRTYFNLLVTLSTTEHQIAQAIEEATLFANERILWIRSSQPLYSNPIPASKETWFVLPAAWSEFGPKLLIEIQSQLAIWLLAGMAFVILLRIRSTLRQEISEIGTAVRRGTSVRIAPTMRSLFLTFSAALPVSASLLFFAWRLRQCAGADTALRAVSVGCAVTAFGYFPTELLRQICRPNGLGEAHFGWSASTLKRLRMGLQWLLPTLAPLVFLTAFLNAGNESLSSDVLERYVFVAVVLIGLVFVIRILNPSKGLPAEYLTRNPDGWFNRTAFAWYPASVAVLAAFVLLPIAGYYFTSQQLVWRTWLTLMLIFGVVLLMAVIQRWVMVRRRQLRIAEIQRKRESNTAEDDMVSAVAHEEDSPEILREQTQQIQRLLGTLVVVCVIVGTYVIWRDVLPALGFLDQWPVWMSTTTVTDSVPGADGGLVPASRDIPDPITISDFILAGLILALTFGGARNLPGLLEFALLRRLPLDRSVRYAITTLASYGIAIIGLMTAGQTIGLHWQQLQYVATALTFGLAFGLQETFANFVAGIIILFEQPVRVGDVVEIDGVTGVVTRIRIRATTISNWDRKDYIVPNKEFITGKLLNWTRTDDISRIVIPVGIAYGSDVDRARQLLLSIAKDHENTLDDPGSSATFEAFGDNALTLTLRTFVGRIDQRLDTIHELHTAIGEAFTKANIEISFPQRDLNLRSVPAAMERAFERLSGQ